MAGYPRVTHPSATNLWITRFHHKSVRLACVKHAASVHPEPGSNSHVNIWLRILCTLSALHFTLCLSGTSHTQYFDTAPLISLTTICCPASFFWLILILLLGLFCSLKICCNHDCHGVTAACTAPAGCCWRETMDPLIALESSGLHYCLFVKVHLSVTVKRDSFHRIP